MVEMTFKKVQKASEAHFANCSTCGVLTGSPFWGPSTTRSLHQSGTGHKVGYVAVSR